MDYKLNDDNLVDPLTKRLAREKVFRTSERKRFKSIENWVTCEVNPTSKTKDPKKQVQWIIDHKWYEENHARITTSFILMIQWLTWYHEGNENVELSS